MSGVDEYMEMKRQKESYDKAREENFRIESKARLSKIGGKKIETTMIGCLSSIETHFGFLWNNGVDMTPEQKQMHELFQKVRSEILDKGNTQKRNLDAELNQYDVKWLRFQVTIPVRPISPKPQSK